MDYGGAALAKKWFLIFIFILVRRRGARILLPPLVFFVFMLCQRTDRIIIIKNHISDAFSSFIVFIFF